ncbi:hypothetical protein KC867_03445 [Candidatus Saccharibacteria bacterium]|nr:hypothetical protein [Candidatus Saccharibacteria bacterium]
MFNAFLATSFIGLVLFGSEFAWKRISVSDEFARKFVHIICGTFIAFLPFWVSYNWVIILAIGFIVVNIFNRYLHFFHAINAVRRKSWGDVLFGVGVLIAALFRPDTWLFAMAIMQVSLADGLAGLIGVTYGQKKGRYYLLSQPKSVIGSLTFLATSIGVMIVGIGFSTYFVDSIQMLPVIVMLPLVLTCIENISVFGMDNITLPLATLFILNLF